MKRNWKTYALYNLVGACLLAVLFLARASTINAYDCAASMAPDQSTGNTEWQNTYTSWKNTYVTSSGAGGFLRVVGDGGNTVSEDVVAKQMRISSLMYFRNGQSRNPERRAIVPSTRATKRTQVR